MRALLALSAAYAAVGFLPLFGGPGYESALALGLLAPIPLSLSCAHRTRALLLSVPSVRTQLSLAWGRSLALAVKWALASMTIACLHGWRVGFCDAVDGMTLLLLGPLCGGLMAAAWGFVAGLATVRTRSGLTSVAAALGPLLGLVISAWRFGSSPMVFAFDPFVGFFAGTLYDTVIVAIPRLLIYRLGSLMTLAALTCACFLLGTNREKGAAYRSRGGATLLGCCGLIACAGSFSVWWWGPQWGHYQSTASIREVLGGRAGGQRCEVVYGQGVSPARAELLVRECHEHLVAHEEFFDTKLTQRITVFAFDSAAQKGALMGASRTYIAKPWRHEVYIQTGGYPHPILGHELAHVVAGNLGTGPFRVAGPLNGWIPDPGRIEGFAVAAAPTENTEYGLMTWARALKDLGALPALSTLFRLSFLGQNSSKAYTVAGAYVTFLRGQYGPGVLHRWYAGQSLREATGGVSEVQLEANFWAALERLPSNASAQRAARARFERPAIFARRCPHEVDAVLTEAAVAYARADWTVAEQLYDSAQRLDPAGMSGRLGVMRCRRRSGDLPGAISGLQALLADESLIERQRVLVETRLGDRLLQAGRLPEARQAYQHVWPLAYDEHQRRSLDVKLLATADIGRREISGLLLGDPEDGVERMSASAALGRWSEREPERGLADYLLAKNLYIRGHWALAEEHLKRSLARPVGLTSVRREALRVGVFLACAQQDWKLVRQRGRRYLGLPGGATARKQGMRRFLGRCLGATPL